MSDPPLSDIDFQMAFSILPLDRIDPKEELYSSQVKFVYQHQPYLFADSTIQVYEVLVNQMTLLEWLDLAIVVALGFAKIAIVS